MSTYHDLRRRRAARRRPAPRPAAPTPLPWSSQYETSVGGLGRDLNLANAGFAAEEANLRQSYGFDDPSDPFSRARQIQQNFERANRGTLNNYAGSGQLYAGSLSNARTIDRNNYERDHDAARKEYAAALQDLAMRRAQAQSDYDQGVLGAEADRLEYALSERPDPMETARRRRRRRR